MADLLDSVANSFLTQNQAGDNKSMYFPIRVQTTCFTTAQTRRD